MTERFEHVDLAIPATNDTNGAAVDISRAVPGSVYLHAFAASLSGTYVVQVAPDGTDNFQTISQDITASSIKPVAQTAARIRLRRGTVSSGALDKATLTYVKRVGG